MENTINQTSKFDRKQFAENQYDKLVDIYSKKGRFGILNRPLRAAELTADVQSNVNNLIEKTNEKAPNMEPLLHQAKNKIETNIQNESLQSMSNLQQSVNHLQFLRDYHQAYPTIEPNILDNKTDSQKMGMLINALNNSGEFDKPLTNSRELLIYRHDIDDKPLRNKDDLSNYFSQQMSAKRAEKIKAVILMDGKIGQSEPQYFQAYKINKFHLSGSMDQYVEFDNAKPIDIDGVAEIATSMAKNNLIGLNIYQKDLRDGFTHPDLTDAANAIETPTQLNFDGLALQEEQQL